MKPQYLRFAVLFVAVASLTGCTMFTEPFAPPQSFDTDADIKALETKFGTASSITGYYDPKAEQNQTTRNTFISGRLALINLNYVVFIREFAASKAQLDTALDIMQLGVDLTITVVGGESVKALLGAASAGITGTRVSINKNFFFEQTVPALITAMNAARKEALIPILRGIKADLTAYPFAAALSDLETYYFAGTFVGGLQAIQKDAGAKEVAADLKIDKIRVGKFGADESSEKINTWLGWDGEDYTNASNREALEQWIEDKEIGGISVPFFVNEAGFRDLRDEFITEHVNS